MPALPRITIVVGPRDSGKTRHAADLADRLRATGLRIGGVVSEAGMRGGMKTSYAFHDLGSGDRMLYARRRPEPIPAGTPGYEFLDTGFAFGCAAIRGAVAGKVDALFVDEIGPLEMNGGGLWDALEEALSAFGGRLVLTVRPSLLDTLRARLGAGGGGAEIVKLPAAAAGSGPQR